MTIARILPYMWIAVLIAVGWYVVDTLIPAPPPVNQYVPAKEAPQLAMIPKTIIQPKSIKVYAQPAKAALKLLPAIQADPNLYALSAVKIKPGLHPQTVVTTLNAETGETETLVRRDPLPWLAFKKTGEARLDYGIKRGFDRVARLSIRQDLLQVKALYAGINASLDSDGAYFAGAGVGYRW